MFSLTCFGKLFDISNIPTREELGIFYNEQNFSCAVEVGVQRAHYSRRILQTWPLCQKYFMVDSWKHTINYTDAANVHDDVQNKLYLEAIENTKKWSTKTVFIRNYSTDAALQFTSGFVDVVYIDARHDYCGVMNDIESWWPKIRVGGIMSGHDYMTAYQHLKAKNSPPWNHLYDPKDDWAICADGKTINEGSVKGAVDAFAKKLNKTVHRTMRDGPHYSWLIQKLE